MTLLQDHVHCRTRRQSRRIPRCLSVAALFAGIGGVELGLQRAGHRTQLLCEFDPAAKRVLQARFLGVELHDDVRTLSGLPQVDLLAAGFPCQDLSQAGRTVGIDGEKSGLVREVFRLLDGCSRGPTWLLLENVPFMLQLEAGKAMRFLTDQLEARGFTWAYRVVDARAFGLPQRRKRVILLASRSEDPRPVLFGEDAGDSGELPRQGREDAPCGFYWTEGLRGWGWTVDGVPTLKGGSTIGIPSPPAIWFPDRRSIETPDIRDAERLQGFDADWTAPAVEDPTKRNGPRWKLVGNAVSVEVSHWVGDRLDVRGPHDGGVDGRLSRTSKWPTAAWGRRGESYGVAVSEWPVRAPYRSLRGFLEHPTRPLSKKATAGFYSRAMQSTLRYDPQFLADVKHHLEEVGQG